MSETTTTVAPTRDAAVVCAAIAVAISVLELLVAACFWVAGATDTSDDLLSRIGYVFAVTVGVPGLLGLLLGGLGWRFVKRPAGLGLAIVGLVVAAVPGLEMVSLWLPAL